MANQFNVGDLVWAKVRCEPWWPSLIYHEDLASSEVRQAKREGFVLVSFFGDNSYKWLDPKKLLHFESNFEVYSSRSRSHLFVKAVNDAVYEVNHRAALGLSCPCQFSSSYRPTPVGGLFEVDLSGYLSGGVYTVQQLEQFKQGFQPVETLSFVQRLALDSIDVPQDFDHSKEAARVLAFRKASYAEVDEPYLQAFEVNPRSPENAIVASNDQETAFIEDPTAHPSNIESKKGEKKSKVKGQNKNKSCLAPQKDKRYKHHDSKRKTSQDHVPQEKIRAKLEFEKKLDLTSPTDIQRTHSPSPFKDSSMSMDHKEITSLATTTKDDDVHCVEIIQSTDTSEPSKTDHRNPANKRQRSVRIVKSAKRLLALSSQKKRKKEETKTTQEGPRMILSMKFPANTTLPSASELKAKFVRFGPIDPSSIWLNWPKSMCRMVFLNQSDAEKAFVHASNYEKMFGQTKVTYRLRPEVPSSYLIEGNRVQQEETIVTPPHSSVSTRSASVYRVQHVYQDIYARYREQVDQTSAEVNHSSVDISEKMLSLLQQCNRIVMESKHK